MYLLYCDESCHLPNDGINTMVLGTVYCHEEDKREIFNDIKKIKEKHNLSPHFEAKWTKVSNGKIELYKDLVKYFFDNDKLSFRGLVAKDKDKLDHSIYNEGNYNFWYYKMYYLLIDKIIFADECYKIFIDIKDTVGGKRIKELHEVLCNNNYDFKQKVIKEINQIHSHESEIMQLTDLLIGALSYFHRDLYKQTDQNAKSKLIDLVKEKSGLILDTSSHRYENKFNLFIWKPRGEY